jgi:hypothetical protein
MSGAAVEPFERVELLIAEVEQWPDAVARDKTRAVVQAVLELHAAGLARVLEIGARKAADFATALAEDDLAGSLLVLHGLHPQDVATRARAALHKLGPTLEAQGAKVELAGAEDGALLVRVTEGSSARRGKSVAALVEETLWAAAPDAGSITVEAVAAADASVIPVERLLSGRGAGRGGP